MKRLNKLNKSNRRNTVLLIFLIVIILIAVGISFSSYLKGESEVRNNNKDYSAQDQIIIGKDQFNQRCAKYVLEIEL